MLRFIIVILYVTFFCIIGLPILLVEMIVGKFSKKNQDRIVFAYITWGQVQWFFREFSISLCSLVPFCVPRLKPKYIRYVFSRNFSFTLLAGIFKHAFKLLLH